MSLYLYAHFWTQLPTLEWTDHVGCLDIEGWEIRENKLLDRPSELLVLSWCGAGEERPKWVYRVAREDRTPHLLMKRDEHGRMRRVPAKPLLCSYTLNSRNQFWIVNNDPKKCQRPNGDIVWRWPELSA